MDTGLAEKVLTEYDELTGLLISAGISVSTMESCTGGLIASLITNTEGSSEILKGAFVTYSNEAKIREGVPAEVIEKHGVYSEETAREMAKACSRAYNSYLGIGVTGSIGRKDPANADSVPGEVFFAIKYGGEIKSYSVTVEESETRMDAKLKAAHVIAVMLKKTLI